MQVFGENNLNSFFADPEGSVQNLTQSSTTARSLTSQEQELHDFVFGEDELAPLDQNGTTGQRLKQTVKEYWPQGVCITYLNPSNTGFILTSEEISRLYDEIEEAW